MHKQALLCLTGNCHLAAVITASYLTINLSKLKSLACFHFLSKILI